MPSQTVPHRRAARRFVTGVLFRCGAVLLGLAPFAAVEFALRAFDQGRVTEIQDPYVGFQAIQPLFRRNAARDRFEIAASRLMLFHPDSFAARKPPGEFRIFCLGGSTVQGSPYTIETSFTTWLELSLRAADATRRWEVVNCGGLSYASYRLVPILREVLTHQADLIIVYTGQNEFLEDRDYAAVKSAPPYVARGHAWLSRLRIYSAARLAWLRLSRRDAAAPRTMLPAEVDAWLDHPGGLNAYHRDDAWRRGVVEHYRDNLQRMVDLARRARVPIVFCNPVTNLKDCPPFKIESGGDLSAAARRRFDQVWREATELAEDRASERMDLLRRALAIDDRHAGAHFMLAHCLLREGRLAEAKQEFIRAKDEDICPLRMIEPMYQALAEVTRANHAPLVDVRALIETRTLDGIPGGEWLLDHVHPTITGHQLIAAALMEEMRRMGLVAPRPGWESRRSAAYRGQMASLDTPYFLRAKERLDGQRKWTEGRASKQHRPAAAPATSGDERGLGGICRLSQVCRRFGRLVVQQK